MQLVCYNIFRQRELSFAMALKTKEAGTMKTEQAQSGKTRTGKSPLRAVACMLVALGAFAATSDVLADADTAITEKYYKFVSTRRASGVNFELTYLALYAADGTVQSDGITCDTSISDPADLAPGKCCTRDKATMGPKSHYGWNASETVDNIFNPVRTGKWCIGSLVGGDFEAVTVNFRLPDDAKPVVGYNLATSIDNNRLPDRRGIAWELYVSSDGRSWRLVDSRDYAASEVPTTNNTFYSPVPYELVNDANQVADAWWTGGAGDNSVHKPANWLCKNALGEVVQGGLPIATTVIHFSGSVNFNFVEGESLKCPRLVFDEGCRLTADVDWRALSYKALQGTLDLNGHTCRLPGLFGHAVPTRPVTGKYYKFVSTRRASGVNFELTYLALYAADGTVQSDGITCDTSISDPSALAPGKCCTRSKATMGPKSHYGWNASVTVDNIFDNGRTNKRCIGSLVGGDSEAVTVSFRLRDDAKPVVGYNLATSIDNARLPERRGIAWDLYVSNDGQNWWLLDSRNCVSAEIPTTDNTLYSPTPYAIGEAAIITSAKTSPVTDKYYKFVSTERVSGPHFELTYLALYAADGTVQSDGITADTSTTDPSALAPGTCCTKDTATGRSSHYGYASTTGGASSETVNNIFDPGRTRKWCVGYQGSNTNLITVSFRLRDDAKPIVGYNLAASIDNNSLPDRRGIAWELYVSADGRYWRRIDCRKYVADDIPKTNNTLYSPEPYPISAANESDYAPLHVNMPAGTTHNNTTVFLSGGVQLVKEGAGTFLATKAHQSYVGGTEVVGGTLKMGTSGDVSILGEAGSDVTICSNTVVDINGIYNNTSYNYALKGGKLAYYGTLLNENLAFNGDYEVLKEGSELAFANVNTSNARFTLHGHTLRTSIARLEGNTVVADAGTLDYHCRFYVKAGATFTAPNATVMANAMHQFAGHATFGTYIEKSTTAFQGENADCGYILGSFRPDTDFFYGFKLNDGVTIDLTTRSTPLPLTSQCSANNTLTFADGATITLDVTGSPLRRGGKVVSWAVGSAPSNINTLKFRCEPAHYKAHVREDGVYLVCNGIMVILR